MALPPKRTVWNTIRRVFRRVRIAAWAIAFLIIFALLYFNLVGLPGFIKRPLQEKLRARGIELDFKNLRLSWYRGLVAYDVSFGQTQDATAPRLTADRVQLGLKGDKLQRLEFQIGTMSLHDGRFVWPLTDTNELALEKINAELRLLEGDEWQLDNLEAQLKGIKIRITGDITNASTLRDWQIPKARTGAETLPEKKRELLQQFARSLDQLQFKSPPVIRMDFTGDALGKTPFRVGIRSQLDSGGLIALAVLNPKTRELAFTVRSDFDVQKIRPLLSAKAGNWLERYTWDDPPQMRFLGRLQLPAWTNALPDWRGMILPTLRLDGEFQVGHAAFRGVPVLSAQSRVLYMNQTWRLPDLQIHRPEGNLLAEHWTHEPTHDYYWHLHGDFDPMAIHSWLEPAQQRGLDLVEFTTPPHFDVEMWGRWHEHNRIGINGHIALSNFTFRGVQITSAETGLEYTNFWLHFSEPHITRGDSEQGSMSSVDVDFQNRMVYLTNGISTLLPEAITHAIGPKTARIMEHYQFLSPPHARIEGSVSTATPKIADLRFDLEGGPFNWWKFNLQQIAGTLVWSNRSLLLTNVTGEFYGGTLSGNAAFDFSPESGDDFNFNIRTTNTSLGLLMPDLGSRTNKLEGNLNLQLLVAWANTKDFHSWQGFGDVSLRDGQLWEIPLFGIFTPVLDTVYPNLGSGRASDGSATFTITNSVIYTDDLELRSPSMRIQYRGSVDFEGNLNARAESELLRNTAIIGPFVSTVFRPVSKLLEYKISGTLAKPVAEPVYIPKMLMFPLHPFQSLKSLFTEEQKTNASPEFIEPPALDSNKPPNE